jgi:hypothetical protein
MRPNIESDKLNTFKALVLLHLIPHSILVHLICCGRRIYIVVWSKSKALITGPMGKPIRNLTYFRENAGRAEA